MPWIRDGMLKHNFETVAGTYVIRDSFCAELNGRVYRPDGSFLGQYLNKTYATSDVLKDAQDRIKNGA